MTERFPTAVKMLKEKGISEDSQILKELPDWLRKAYLTDINYCEHLSCKNKNLDIHRMTRAWDNGTYWWTNVKVVCKAHHFLYHANEFNHVHCN